MLTPQPMFIEVTAFRSWLFSPPMWVSVTEPGSSGSGAGTFHPLSLLVGSLANLELAM